MNHRPIRIAAFALVGSLLAATPAQAQHWTVSDRQPRPYFILGLDTSMTMARDNVGNWAPGLPTNHLARAQRALVGTSAFSYQNGAMYLFRDAFVWGGYAYSGARYAKIKTGSSPSNYDSVNTVVAPDWTNLGASYNNTVAMIQGLSADYCQATKNSANCMERYLPGGVGSPACITSNCLGDAVVLDDLFQRLPNPLGGLTIPALQSPPNSDPPQAPYPPTWPRYTWRCTVQDPTGYPDYNPAQPLPAGCPDVTNPACPVVNILYELAHEVGPTYMAWPRYDASNPIDPNQVNADLCGPLGNAFAKINLKLQACTGTAAPNLVPAFSCNPNALANTICLGNSPFNTGSVPTPTCVCDATNPACIAGGGINECGHNYTFPARQQVGICRSHAQPGTLTPATQVRNLPGDDNELQNPANNCRSGAVAFVTDGLDGVGAISEDPDNRSFYFADNNVPQNTVIKMGPYVGQANGLQQILRGGAPVPAFDGDAGVNNWRGFLQSHVQRSRKGTFAAASPTLTPYQDRAAFMVMQVPGVASPVGYANNPIRLDWHVVDPLSGAVGARLFSTDEATLAGAGATPIAGNGVTQYLGPWPGTWRGSNVQRVLTIPANTLDRNGDGVVGDTHPSVTWGYHLGGEGNRPVIVGSPEDAFNGLDRVAGVTWQRTTPGVFDRDRIAYVLSNGYLHAYRVGCYSASPTTIGDVQAQHGFDDSATCPGRGVEVFRYRPDFLEAAGNETSVPIGATPLYTLNDVAQQSLIQGGQLVAREVQLSSGPPVFATVLIMSQGRSGRGYAALNVSDPSNPVKLWDRVLLPAGGRATAEPAIYDWPDPANDKRSIPVLVLTSGGATAATNQLYVYRVVDGTLLTSVNLGATRSWPTAPVCADLRGAGRVTHCYVQAQDGTVIRSEVVQAGGGAGSFTNLRNITPGGLVGGGRTFYTGMAAYFTAKNELALVMGSGNVNLLERGDGVANRAFKIVDDLPRTGNSALPARLNNVCAPAGAPMDGQFSLGANEMVISRPTVSKGTVAFTAYRPGPTGCQEGTASLYAFDFESCKDQLTGALAKPTGQPAGDGMPYSPVILRRAQRVVVHSTGQPTGSNATNLGANTRGGRLELPKMLFFRVREKSS